MLRREEFDAFRLGPLVRGFISNLHQADLPGPAVRPRIEPALAPHDGFDQRRINAIPLPRGKDRFIMTVLAIDAEQLKSRDQQENENDAEDDPFAIPPT